MEAPTLHKWVVDDLARLAKAGVTPTLAESVWLAELAKAAHSPPGRESYIDPASPVVFSGLEFWPLTMLAQRWFVTWFEAFADQQDIQVGVYVFAHLHSKPGDLTLRQLSTLDTVAATVSAYLDTMPVRADQLPALQAALAGFYPEAPDVPDPPVPGRDAQAEDVQASTPEERAGSLCALFAGTTPDFWLTGISERQAMMVAAGKVAAESADGVWANSPLRTRRIASYMNAIKWIVQRAEKERANGA